MRRTTAIVGLGVTGLSCVRHLHGRDRLVVIDSRVEPPGLAAVREQFPDVALRLGVERADFAGVDRVVVSPGIGLDSCMLAELPERLGCVSDIDLFFEAATAPVIGITGTNGKSTVTSLTGHLLAACGRRVGVGGNLGRPALDLLDPEIETYVLELSSFQLERMAAHPLRAATILNVSEDHLDRHHGMNAYVASKQRIYRNCELAVAFRDDPRTLPATHSGRLVTFGADAPERGHWGVIESGDGRWLARGDRRVIGCDELPIAGRHNEQNVLAAFALLENAAISVERLAEGVRSFRGLRHRCERVANVSGVVYVNDSKGTNIGATEAALAGFGDVGRRNLVLIAGGDGKGADFSTLRTAVERHVKGLVLLGRDAPLLERALADVVDVHRVTNMDEAVAAAARIATPGDLVLLSPACSSLDMYRNYEARGEHFERCVRSLSP